MSHRVVLNISGALINLLAEHDIDTPKAGKMLAAISRASNPIGTAKKAKKKSKIVRISDLTDQNREFHEATRRQAIIGKLINWAKTCEGACPLDRKKVRRDGDHDRLWDALAAYLAKGPALTKKDRLNLAKQELLSKRGLWFLKDESDHDRNGLQIKIGASGSIYQKVIDITSVKHPTMSVISRGSYCENVKRHEMTLAQVLPEIAYNEIEKGCMEAMTRGNRSLSMPVETLIDWAAYTGPVKCHLSGIQRTDDDETKIHIDVPTIRIEVES